MPPYCRCRRRRLCCAAAAADAIDRCAYFAAADATLIDARCFRFRYLMPRDDDDIYASMLLPLCHAASC